MPGSASTEILVARETDTLPVMDGVSRIELLASDVSQRRETLVSDYTYEDSIYSEEVGQIIKDRVVISVDYGGLINTLLFPFKSLDYLLANAIRSEDFGIEWSGPLPFREVWDGYADNRLIIQKQVEDSNEGIVYQVYRHCIVNGVTLNLGADLEPRSGISIAAEYVDIRTAFDGPLLPPVTTGTGSAVRSIRIDQANSSNNFDGIQIDRIFLTFANAFSYRRGIGVRTDPEIRSRIRRGRVVVRGYFQGRFDSEIALEEARNREESEIGFIVEDSNGKWYQFYLPRIRVDNSSVISAAAGNPVIARIDFYALAYKLKENDDLTDPVVMEKLDKVIRIRRNS